MMICSLQRVCICQSCQRRVILVHEISPPGSTTRLRFSCKFSFILSFFWRGGDFECSPTCLVGSIGSEGFLISGGFLGTLVPCAYYLSLRDYLGGHSLGLSLNGLLGKIRIVGVICSFPCSLSFSVTCPLGTIWYRCALRILFWIWSLSVIYFPMDSCSSLMFGYFPCSCTCPLGEIDSRGASNVYFWPWSPSVFYFPMDYCSSLVFMDFLYYSISQQEGLDIRMYQKFPFDLAPLVFSPLLWFLVLH